MVNSPADTGACRPSARGVQEGAFALPADDFNRRFIALLDGLALQRLQRMEETSRKHLTELVMHAARIELPPGLQGPDPAKAPVAV